jgi:iron complex outermembrane receptor protein
MMMPIDRKLMAAAVTGWAALTYPLAALAAADEGGEANTVLEEVVVTAQKRSEKAVDVPISVTALSESALQNAGITDMSSLAQAVPGMHVDMTGAFYQPSIRGVGTAVAGQGVSPSVATYVDGIYHPNPLANDFNFIDVDSIEVLKGPQGTLFGRNTTAGAILVTTKQPTFDPQLQMKVGYGSFNTASVSLFASQGLTDQLAGSIAAGYTRSDGYIKNLADGSDAGRSNTYLVRAKLLFQPSDSLKFTLAFDTEQNNDPTGFAAGTYNGYSDGPAFFGVPSISNDRRHILIEPGTYAHYVKGYGVILKSEADLSFAKLTSFTSAHWDRGHEASNEAASLFPANGTLPVQPCPTLETCSFLATGAYSFLDEVSWDDKETTYSQEFDLNSNPGGPIDWVTGLYYSWDRTSYAPERLGIYGPFGAGGALTGALPPWPASSYVHFPFLYINEAGGVAESAAIFADGTYNLDKFHFTLGGRFALDRPSVFHSAPANLANGFVDVPYLSDAQKFYSFTPRAVIRYSLTPDSNVYVSWSKGEKAGVYNASGYAAERDVIKPEKITDIEGGYKLATGSSKVEFSAFHYDYSNLQVSTYQSGIALIQNAPKSEMWGADLHLEQRVADGFKAQGGVAYTHARYVKFTNAAYQAFDTLHGVQNLSADVSGGVMERTPSVTANVGLDYSHTAFGGLLGLNANYSYQTKASFDFPYTLVQGSYGLLNMRGAWTDPSGHWTLAVTGRNLTNKQYLSQILPDSGGFGAVWGPPPNVTAELSYRR